MGWLLEEHARLFSPVGDTEQCGGLKKGSSVGRPLQGVDRRRCDVCTA